MTSKNLTTDRTPALFALFLLTLALLLVLPALAFGQSDSALARSAADDYRQSARYPEWSKPVAAGQPDPVRAGRVPTRHSLGGPNGEAPELTLWSEETSFVAPEPAVLHATLEGPGRSPIRGAVVTGRVVDPSGGVLGEVRYLDDGVAPDAKRGDGVYTAVYQPDAMPELATSFLVEVHATLPDGASRSSAAGFLYSNPWGRLTGAFKDEVRDGDLVVLAEVEVSRAGRFHLSGTLTRPNGEPIGWAQSAGELAPGTHWIELEFFGLMFRERGAAGPFRLGSVTLATTSGMPNALGPVLENVHKTRAYPLARFGAEPFADAALLRAAERLEGVPAQ